MESTTNSLEYLRPLLHSFKQSSDVLKAKWMKDYLKGQFEFFGIQTPERKKAQAVFFKAYGYPSRPQLFEIVFALWDQPQRECQYAAIELLRKYSKELEVSDIQKIERLILIKPWWDTIDGISPWVCGTYFRLYPEKILPVTNAWLDSGNIWLRRSVILFQLKYKDETNTKLLSNWINLLSKEKEFFIQKAIGWILREYSKTNPNWVRKFVSNNTLSSLSYREATRYI